MNPLDDPTTYAVDSHDMLGQLDDLLERFDQAVADASALELPFPANAVDDVVIAGMGSSADVGSMIVGAFWERVRKPVRVVRGYGLPGWVGERSLVIGATYSGETEETLTCVADAVDRTCPVIGISTGGKMTGFYRPAGVPVLEPPVAPNARSAGVQMLAGTLVLLQRMGVLEHLDRDLDEAREVLATFASSYGRSVPRADNPAKQVAASLHGTLPLIWGAQMTSPVAEYWRGQIGAAAKTPVVTGEFPEHNHGDLPAVDGYGDVNLRPHLVILRDPRQHRQVQRRLDAARGVFESAVSAVTTISATGTTDLARLLDLMVLGDAVAIHLACARGVDPAAPGAVTALHEELATTGYGRSRTPAPPV